MKNLNDDTKKYQKKQLEPKDLELFKTISNKILEENPDLDRYERIDKVLDAFEDEMLLQNFLFQFGPGEPAAYSPTKLFTTNVYSCHQSQEKPKMDFKQSTLLQRRKFITNSLPDKKLLKEELDQDIESPYSNKIIILNQLSLTPNKNQYHPSHLGISPVKTKAPEAKDYLIRSTPHYQSYQDQSLGDVPFSITKYDNNADEIQHDLVKVQGEDHVYL